jgi:hypothetical protein
MDSRQGRRFAAAALLVFAAGCRSSRPADLDPYAAQPVVTKLGNAKDAAVDESARVAAAQTDLAAAEQAWRSGDALGALAIVQHALLAGVPSTFESSFRELRARARAAVVATKVCRVRALPEKDVVADGTPISVRIEFANLASATLTVPMSEKGSSAATVVLTLVRSDFDVFGNDRSTRYTLAVPVRQDLVLAPGRTQETPLVVPAEMSKLGHEGFSILELEGAFRPVTMRVGESEFFDAIPIEKARVRIFQKGFEPLAADPLGSLAKSIAKRSPPHVLACAELVAPSDRAKARTLLEEAKAKDAELAIVVDAALARLAATR